ncbi:unnamed protein product [Ceratitis capitata]|uniref:(Mediterranean fruit fly) hypothetical protein n=1 Tax=Ceratitis capitata TaxID=7213 RepID=A0A811UAI9_CERCA|nr:unnamed protein product [Ceratitis capitata]
MFLTSSQRTVQSATCDIDNYNPKQVHCSVELVTSTDLKLDFTLHIGVTRPVTKPTTLVNTGDRYFGSHIFIRFQLDAIIGIVKDVKEESTQSLL